MGKETQKKQEAQLLKEMKYWDALDKKKREQNVKKRVDKKSRPKDEIRSRVIEWFLSFRSTFAIHEIRKIEDFKVISFNEHNLKILLIKHMYCKYRVPEFVLSEFVKSILGDDRFSVGTKLTAKLFFDITSGRSFYKENKELFTKKEAHYFLTASNKRSIAQNILWSKCKSRGILEHFEALSRHQTIINNLRTTRTIQFIDFITKNKHRKISDRDLHDVIDYISRHPDTSFKGRTWSSIKRLSHRWHVRSHWASYVREYTEWNRGGASYNWKYIDKDFDISWEFIELLNTNELLEESNVMHHCVVTYANSCISGSTRIFSLSNGHEYHNKRNRCITIEVRGNKIYQIRGKYNRKADVEEMKVINLWMKKFGIQNV